VEKFPLPVPELENPGKLYPRKAAKKALSAWFRGTARPAKFCLSMKGIKQRPFKDPPLSQRKVETVPRSQWPTGGENKKSPSPRKIAIADEGQTKSLAVFVNALEKKRESKTSRERSKRPLTKKGYVSRHQGGGNESLRNANIHVGKENPTKKGKRRPEIKKFVCISSTRT